ncbi:hypothetical protein K7H06_14745 [Crassaminicella profunda]|nr:hypothetical protein K7H06_14745 [Crassaminicella profunda]
MTLGGVSPSSASTSIVVDGETLTIKDGLGGSHTVTIEKNTTDDLAVDGTGGNLTIKLANATESKNTAALIETAVQGLGVVDGTDFSKWTFTGSANWDSKVKGDSLTQVSGNVTGGHPIVPSIATIIVDGQTLKITDPTGTNNKKIIVAQGTNDALSVNGVGGDLKIYLANATGSKNNISEIKNKLLTPVDGSDFSKWTFETGTIWDGEVEGSEVTTDIDKTLAGGKDTKTEKLAVYNYQFNKPFTEGEAVSIGDITFKAVKVTPPEVADPLKGEFDIGTDVSTQIDSLVEAINNSSLKDKYTATRTGINGNILTLEEKGTASGEALSVPKTFDLSRSTSLIIEAKEGGKEGNDILIEDGFYEDYKVSLQIGANEHQEFAVSIGDIRAEELGLSGKPGEKGFCKILNVTNGSNNTPIEAALDVTSKEGANIAIERYQKAIEKVSELRARLGAYQNRLEHTISNIDNASENLTAALSRIQDVDMALAMSEYTKLNILQQSGTAMLAQANQRPQSILQLLQ